MSTTFTWTIAQLERETADGFVFTAHYRLNAKDDIYTAGTYGCIGLERPENLIPYADLTEDIVIGWVQDAIGPETVAAAEVALQSQIDEQRTPTRAAGVPWL
jgi:hypothetical protein